MLEVSGVAGRRRRRRSWLDVEHMEGCRIEECAQSSEDPSRQRKMTVTTGQSTTLTPGKMYWYIVSQDFSNLRVGPLSFDRGECRDFNPTI